jgi:hypothetical protein
MQLTYLKRGFNAFLYCLLRAELFSWQVDYKKAGPALRLARARNSGAMTKIYPEGTTWCG